MPDVILLALNVITLLWFSYSGLLSAYTQLCNRYEYAQCTLLHQHIYTGCIHKTWPTNVRKLDLIGQLDG